MAERRTAAVVEFLLVSRQTGCGCQGRLDGRGYQQTESARIPGRPGRVVRNPRIVGRQRCSGGADPARAAAWPFAGSATESCHLRGIDVPNSTCRAAGLRRSSLCAVHADCHPRVSVDCSRSRGANPIVRPSPDAGGSEPGRCLGGDPAGVELHQQRPGGPVGRLDRLDPGGPGRKWGCSTQRSPCSTASE